MRALVIANLGDDDAGYVGERLQQRGYQLVLGYRDGVMPDTTAGYDLVVLLGSDWSTYWDHVRHDVERETALVRDADQRAVPVLGICYGAQLLAQAFGGHVRPAAHTEIGWFAIETADGHLAPSGPWFEFHSDTWAPPEGATVLAHTPAGPQAFRYRRMLAWQFHPEVSPEIVRRWGAGSRDQAAREGIDLEDLYLETDAQCVTARERCHRLVDAFLDDVAAVTPPV